MPKTSAGDRGYIHMSDMLKTRWSKLPLPQYPALAFMLTGGYGKAKNAGDSWLSKNWSQGSSIPSFPTIRPSLASGLRLRISTQSAAHSLRISLVSPGTPRLDLRGPGFLSPRITGKCWTFLRTGVLRVCGNVGMMDVEHGDDIKYRLGTASLSGSVAKRFKSFRQQPCLK